MIAAASKRDWRKSVSALVGDAHHLPFDDEKFDDVLVFHTLAYVEEPRRVIDEAARVLRPGGRIVVLSLNRHSHGEITASYGERHPGFTAVELRKMLTRAKLHVTHADIATLSERMRPIVSGLMRHQDIPVAVLDLNRIFENYHRGLG